MIKHRSARGVAAATALVLAGTLTACTQDQGTSVSETGDAPLELRLGHIYSSTSTQQEGALRFAELVEEKTSGAVTIDVFPDGQLGGDEALGEDLGRGALDFAFLGVGSMSGVNPLLDFHYLPYIATTYDEVDALFYGDGIIRQTLEGELEKLDIVPLAKYEVEFRSVTNSRHAVQSVDDLTGLKLRVPGSAAIRGFFDAAAAQTVIMPFPELLAALEQRTVDGQDNGIQMTKDSGLSSSQTHITLTNHVMATGFIAGGQQLWETLDEDTRAAILEAAQEAQEFQVSMSRERAGTYVADLRAEGNEVVELTTAQMKEFQKFGLALWDGLAGVYGAERIASLKAELEALR